MNDASDQLLPGDRGSLAYAQALCRRDRPAQLAAAKAVLRAVPHSIAYTVLGGIDAIELGRPREGMQILQQFDARHVPMSEQQAEKLRSRLRQKDAALVCWGSWPRCEARLSVHSSVWTGLGQGHGRLQDRRVVVDVVRGTAPRRSVSLWISADGSTGESQRLEANLAEVGADQVLAG